MILNKFNLKKKILRNRISISPMCQYSSLKNGSPSDWHYYHLKKLMNVGAGMLVLESTAVSKNGRITDRDLTLSTKKNMVNFKKLVNFIKKNSPTSVVIQLSHAGRKGSSWIPWVKANSPLKNSKKWQTFSASKIKKDKSWPIPRSLELNQIKKIKEKFVNSVKFAFKAGFDGIELHMAHGYLLHQFLSPISNKRNDIYGGNLENRCRLPLEIGEEITKILPKNKILGARITGLDHIKNGINLKESIYLARKLKKLKFDYVCISSGGIKTKTNMKFKSGFRVNIAKKIKDKVGILVRSSGGLSDLNYANKILKKKKLDFIAIGREFIKNPMVIYQYIKKNNLNEEYIPKQYKRCFNEE